MLKLIDYIFYRIYSLYKKQGSDVTHVYASGLLSLLQFMTVVSILFLINIFIGFSLPSKWGFAPLLIIFMILNWYRYERNFDIEEFAAQWKDEDSSEKKKKGWLIIVYFAIVVLFPVTLGVLEHNLGVI